MQEFVLNLLGFLALGAFFSGVSVYILMARRLVHANERAAAIASAKGDLDLLRARVRGIQGHGKDIGKGEVMYNLQSANGKFAKVTLPRV